MIAGFGGGVVRGVVGFIKYQFQFKNTKFDITYFLGMMSLSGVVGVLTALAGKERVARETVWEHVCAMVCQTDDQRCAPKSGFFMRGTKRHLRRFYL
ncbi:MAG: hypothetical protein A3F26_01775 [Candidatus Ryanbacteria bacterium RIFCSPHIGHO2_12_FULL_47_12b]|nr:MAG: hypothetical protein A3F26_01775 [Candidatus Ryanbacteria bacterium RIFCSPHIGHO2_12_FULL_47_12b]